MAYVVGSLYLPSVSTREEGSRQSSLAIGNGGRVGDVGGELPMLVSEVVNGTREIIVTLDP